MRIPGSTVACLMIGAAILGYVVAEWVFDVDDLWNDGQGLQNLEDSMETDKSKRLAMIVLTEKTVYSLKNLPPGYDVMCGFKKK